MTIFFTLTLFWKSDLTLFRKHYLIFDFVPEKWLSIWLSRKSGLIFDFVQEKVTWISDFIQEKWPDVWLYLLTPCQPLIVS